jgi:hypothetical protein
MAKKSRPTIKKRQREMARLQKQQDKQARRLAAKERPEGTPRSADGEDPDIAGIRPGPQPIVFE